MKRIALLAIALVALATLAQADNITLQSGTNVLANGANAVALQGDSHWASALGTSNWISFARTDFGANNYLQVDNGTGVTFTQTFNLSGIATGGSLTIMADDTASVILNGHTLVNAASMHDAAGNCSLVAGCLSENALTLNFAQLAPFLQTGTNTLQFIVYQQHGWSFGLDYSGQIIDPPADNHVSDVPEPASLALLGTGLSLIGTFVRRRIKL